MEKVISRMHNPAHPGEMLREWIPAGMTEADAAARLGVACETLLSKCAAHPPTTKGLTRSVI